MGGQVLEEKGIYCQHHRSEVSQEQCIKAFVTDSVIRGFCLIRKCESPVKPCVTCVEQEVGQPKDECPKYFFAEKGSKQCHFHNKHGKDANPEIEFLKKMLPVKEIKEPAIETKEVQQGQGGETMDREVVVIEVKKITSKIIRKRGFHGLEKLTTKITSGTYDPIRVKDSGDGTFHTSTSNINYNERVLEAAKLAGVNQIKAIISGRGSRHKKEATAEPTKKEVKVRTTDAPADPIELLLNLTPETLRSALEKKMTSQLDTVMNTCHALAGEAEKMKNKIKK